MARDHAAARTPRGRYATLALNTALFALNSMATKLIAFLLVPLYTTYLSAGEYGLTDMSLTVIGLLTPLVTLSMADACVRFLVADRARGDRYLAVSMAITVASIAVVAALSPLLDLEAFGGLGAYRGWFIVAYAASALQSYCGEATRGMGEIKLIPVCEGVASVVTLACAIVFVGALGWGVTGYFVSVTIGPICAITGYLIFGGLARAALRGVRELARGGATAVRETLSPMVRYAFPLIPNALFWWVTTSISRIFITGMLGIAASGMFAAASKVPNLLNIVYMIFQQAWQLSAYQEANDGDAASFFEQVFRVLQAGLTLLCTLISFTAPWLALIPLRGETYASWTMISVLLIANLMSMLNAFFGTVYTMTLHTSYILKTAGVGAVVCAVLTPALIIPWGTYGACAASAVSQGVVFVLRVRDSRKYLSFDRGWRTLVPTLVLLVVQAAVTALQLEGWHVISGVCVAGVVAIQGARLAPVARRLVASRRGACDDAS